MPGTVEAAVLVCCIVEVTVCVVKTVVVLGCSAGPRKQLQAVDARPKANGASSRGQSG